MSRAAFGLSVTSSGRRREAILQEISFMAGRYIAFVQDL